MAKKNLLTGIKPTGRPHLGNYLGVIKPALAKAKSYNTFFFIADYHALNQTKDPKKLYSDILEITAVWLACGLNPEEHIFYCQSSIPEIAELNIILANVTSKGLLNRSHAYKAVVQENLNNNNDPDKNVNMGLFNYPLLMSADILMFHTDIVPVGPDQVQHVELARNIGEAFNRTYGDTIILPMAEVNKNVETILGTDGRKMSKSYSNVIPLFGKEKEIKKAVMKIITNSQEIDEPKNPDTCNVFSLYKNFANTEELQTLREKYERGGMSWGEAKTILFEKLQEHFAPLQEKYNAIKDDEDYLKKTLELGAKKAREVAKVNLFALKKKIGIL